MSEKFGLWGRFGITLEVSLEEAETIINAPLDVSRNVLAKIFSEGRAMFDGDSYIPGLAIEQLNLDSDSQFPAEDIELDTGLLDGKRVRPVQKKPPERGLER